MILVNIGALAWNIHQTNIQKAETKILAELTAQLDDRVNRLSANLDQRIHRLNRLIELVTGAFQSAYKLNQRMQQAYEKEAGVSYAEGFASGNLSIEEIIAHNVNVETLFIEVIAIARVTGDEELLSRTEQFAQSLPVPEKTTSDEDWLAGLGEFRSAAIAMHERTYQLLEEATAVR